MPKEILRKLMKTQWVQDRLKEDWVREISEDWIIDSFRRDLKPEGKPLYDEFVNSLQKGEKIALSNYIEMFLGFDFKSGIKGLENLTVLKNKPILLVANHHSKGPLGGDWENVVISYYIQQTLAQELRDLHGNDPTTIRNLFRIKGQESTNSIPVRDPNPQRSALLLRRAIMNRDSLRLYPEGDGGVNLRKGLPDAGRLIAICAMSGMDIATCSVRFQSDTFFLTFDTLDNQEIERLGSEKNSRAAVGQNIADYAMEIIARHLPESRRGYYRNHYS